MGVKSACCVGCCVTIAIVALLIGINGIMRYRGSELDHEETAAYNIPGNCTLQGYFHRVARTTSGDDCNIWRYLLDVGPLTPGGAPLGARVAYSNFFPNRCDGTRYNSSFIGERIPCWVRTADTELVRVSPVLMPEEFYLQVGASALAISGAILLAFLVYNVVLWLGVCADVGPFSQENVRRRQEADAAAAADRARIEAEAREADDPNAFRTDNISVADRGWLSDMAFNNAYATAVIRRFGHGEELDMASREPTAAAAGEVEMSGDHPPRSATEPIGAPEAGAATVVVGAAAASKPSVGDGNEKGDDIDDVPAECCVCWDPLGSEAIVFPCFHMSCSACVERLARAAASRTDHLITCPMCRRQAFPAELRKLLRVGPAPDANPVAHAEDAPEPSVPGSADDGGHDE